jgi:hypothetical protein
MEASLNQATFRLAAGEVELHAKAFLTRVGGDVEPNACATEGRVQPVVGARAGGPDLGGIPAEPIHEGCPETELKLLGG